MNVKRITQIKRLVPVVGILMIAVGIHYSSKSTRFYINADNEDPTPTITLVVNPPTPTDTPTPLPTDPPSITPSPTDTPTITITPTPTPTITVTPTVTETPTPTPSTTTVPTPTATILPIPSKPKTDQPGPITRAIQAFPPLIFLPYGFAGSVTQTFGIFDKIGKYIAEHDPRYLYVIAAIFFAAGIAILVPDITASSFYKDLFNIKQRKTVKPHNIE